MNVYLPTRGKDPEFIEAVDAIKSVIEQNATDNQRIILMGDLNISITSSARRREAWSSLITDFDLKDNVTGINTHFESMNQKEGRIISGLDELRVFLSAH